MQTQKPETERITDPDAQIDAIDEFAIASEHGFLRVEGPWTVQKDWTTWLIKIDREEFREYLDGQIRGKAGVLIKDGMTMGGGIVQEESLDESVGLEGIVAIDQDDAGVSDD